MDQAVSVVRHASVFVHTYIQLAEWTLALSDSAPREGWIQTEQRATRKMQKNVCVGAKTAWVKPSVQNPAPL